MDEVELLTGVGLLPLDEVGLDDGDRGRVDLRTVERLFNLGCPAFCVPLNDPTGGRELGGLGDS